MVATAASVPITVSRMISRVSCSEDGEGVEVVVGAPDGVPLAVAVGTILVGGGNRELATADNDCWTASVTNMHRVPSCSASVLF